jgi:hypothetical protein
MNVAGDGEPYLRMRIIPGATAKQINGGFLFYFAFTDSKRSKDGWNV